MKLGGTFIWFPPEDREEKVYIAVTDPQKNGGNFAAFNLTRSKGGKMALTFVLDNTRSLPAMTAM